MGILWVLRIYGSKYDSYYMKQNDIFRMKKWIFWEISLKRKNRQQKSWNQQWIKYNARTGWLKPLFFTVAWSYLITRDQSVVGKKDRASQFFAFGIVWGVKRFRFNLGSPTEFKRDAMRSESGSLGGTQYTRFNIYTLIDQSEATHGFKIQRLLAHSYACADFRGWPWESSKKALFRTFHKPSSTCWP